MKASKVKGTHKNEEVEDEHEVLHTAEAVALHDSTPDNTHRVGDSSEINPINNSRVKRRSAAPVWSKLVYSMETRICGLIPEIQNHFYDPLI